MIPSQGINRGMEESIKGRPGIAGAEKGRMLKLEEPADMLRVSRAAYFFPAKEGDIVIRHPVS